jgi:hypothetical protein
VVTASSSSKQAREIKIEDVSDDDLYAYFFDKVASEDVDQAIDDYVDEKVR